MVAKHKICDLLPTYALLWNTMPRMVSIKRIFSSQFGIQIDLSFGEKTFYAKFILSENAF